MTGLDTLPKTDPTAILRYRDGLYAVDLLTAAIVEFGFFQWLSNQPSSLEEICDHFGWATRPADVLVTLGKVNHLIKENKEGIFSLSQTGREHLCDDSPWNLSRYYESLKDRPVVGDFVRVLKTGKPAHWSGHEEADADWHGAMLNEGFAEAFTEAMDCRGVFLGKKLADALSDHFKGRTTRVLDIGGGSGVYSSALAANFPDLEASVFEMAPVDGIARRKIGERNFSDRVNVITGDMFNDQWPEGFDVHLFSNVMHDWDVPEILTLLKKSRETISGKDGLVLIHETFLNAEKTGPIPVAEYSCIIAHSTQGRCYSEAEMGDYLIQSGFEMINFQETGGDRGLIIGKPI